MCASVLVESWFWSLAGNAGGGFADKHMCRDSEMACDGQGKTRRISPVCLRERSCRVTHTQREKSVSGMDFMCVYVCYMRRVGHASGWFCVRVCVYASARVTDPGAIYFQLV